MLSLNTFSRWVEDNSNAPVRIWGRCEEIWKEIFKGKPFPEQKGDVKNPFASGNLDLGLMINAIKYRLTFLEARESGEEVTDKFVERYNQAINFKPTTALQKLFAGRFSETNKSKTLGDSKMKLVLKTKTTKITIPATTKKTTKTVEKIPVKKAGKGVRGAISSLIAKMIYAQKFTNRQIIDAVQKSLGKTIEHTTIYGVRCRINKSGHDGLAAPKKPFQVIEA